MTHRRPSALTSVPELRLTPAAVSVGALSSDARTKTRTAGNLKRKLTHMRNLREYKIL